MAEVKKKGVVGKGVRKFRTEDKSEGREERNEEVKPGRENSSV